jgi:hypothetical protein
MSPLAMRDAINGALGHTKVRVSGVAFTRAGNIAVTLMAPSTADELARYVVFFGDHIAHGISPGARVFELDGPWPSLVLHDVHMPAGEDVWMVEQAICEELGMWNPCLRDGVKDVQVLCQAVDIPAKPRITVRISFAADEVCVRAMRDGICAYGDQLQLSPYKERVWQRDQGS